MNNFQKAEQVGRDKFNKLAEKLGFTNVSFSKGEFDTYDVTYEYQGRKYITEIKNRNVSSTQYPDIMLEVSKANSLYSKAIESDRTPIYVNFFTDNVAVMFNLFLIDRKTVKSRDIWCPKTTSDFNNNNKVSKKCLFLEINAVYSDKYSI